MNSCPLPALIFLVDDMNSRPPLKCYLVDSLTHWTCCFHLVSAPLPPAQRLPHILLEGGVSRHIHNVRDHHLRATKMTQRFISVEKQTLESSVLEDGVEPAHTQCARSPPAKEYKAP